MIQSFKCEFEGDIWELNAKNKYAAYAAFLLWFRNNPQFVRLLEPKEIVQNDQWYNPEGKIKDRVDEIYGGKGAFEEYRLEYGMDIADAFKTIKHVKDEKENN